MPYIDSLSFLTIILGRAVKTINGLKSLDILFNKINPPAIISIMISIPEKIIANIFDPHPNTISRINSQIEYIEREIQNNRDLSPKIIKPEFIV